MEKPTLVASPAPAQDPDADLVRLEAEIATNSALLKAAERAFTVAEETMFAWEMANPKPTKEAECAAKRSCRYDETEAEWHAWTSKVDALVDEVAQTCAMTFRGLQIKARLACNDVLDTDCQAEIARSIAEDVVHMGSQSA